MVNASPGGIKPDVEDVPTKSLPLESNLAASAPPSLNAMVSAAGKNIPVLLSPVGLIDGSAVVPAPIVKVVAATDVNTLDDYEEGTHTATLTPSTSGSITLNASYQTLTYTKVGRLVSIRGTLIASSSSSPVGYVTVSLPFTPAAVVGLGYAGGSVFVDGATGVNANQFVLAIFTSGARIYLGDSTGLQSDSAQAIASSGQVYFEMNYHV